MTDPQWDGAVNLRDLGGLPLRDGGVTASGVIFRSGRPETITEQGWAQAATDGLTTVIDLRNDDELGRRDTDAPLPDGLPEPIRVAHRPTEDPTHTEFKALCQPYLNTPKHYPENLDIWPERFAGIFREIAAADGAVLVHCSGGRDRTGMVTALLLQLAGVDDEAILDDYEVGVRAANKRNGEIDHPHEKQLPPEEIDSRVAQTRGHLRDLLDTFDAATYLRDAGVSDDELGWIRTRLRGEQAA